MSTISKLATYVHLTSKNYGDRDPSSIKFIVPHHMAGIMTAANAADWFCNNGRDNSVNYCVGTNGGISCNVPEEKGPWTSSWWRVDTKAITIEVSNNSRTSSKWPVSDAAIEDLIRLMVDLIQRYPSMGGKAVFDPNDEYEVVAARAADREPKPKGNILLHNWTDKERKICPGPYMTEHMPAICAEVNRRLSVKRTLHEEAQYMIDHGVNGSARRAQARADGFDPDKVQAEIDKMLAKDPVCNNEIVAKLMPVLQRGSTGITVTILQELLAYMGYLTVAPDGIFGGYTETAVKAFQSNINVVYGNFPVDGICGTRTWNRLLMGK